MFFIEEIYRCVTKEKKLSCWQNNWVSIEFEFANVRKGLGIQNYDSYLSLGHHATMGWMVRSRPPRENPYLLLPDAKSILTLGIDYRWPNPPEPTYPYGRVAMYAWGRDYHKVLTKRLKKLLDGIRERYDGVQGFWGLTLVRLSKDHGLNIRDSAISEKIQCSFHRGNSSYFFLAMLMLNIEIKEDVPLDRDHCGKCVRCLTKCPTNAFVDAYKLDSRRCISYLTIEHKGSIPHQFRSAMGNWLFGCDVCQDVCPHNGKNFDSSGNLQDLAPKPKQPFVDLHWLLQTPNKVVDDYFAGTPLRRGAPDNSKEMLVLWLEILGMKNSKHLWKGLLFQKISYLQNI